MLQFLVIQASIFGNGSGLMWQGNHNRRLQHADRSESERPGGIALDQRSADPTRTP
jgi:hypothetical protein